MLEPNQSQIVTGSDDRMWSQIVTTSKKHRRDTYIPYAFTEQGVAMLSSVLRSEKAIHVNIAIMRAFVAMRRFALTFAELSQKMAELEAKSGKDIADIHEVLRWLGEENQSRSAEIAALAPHFHQLGKSPIYWIQNRGLSDNYDLCPHVKNRHPRQQTCPLAGSIYPGRTHPYWCGK